MLDQQKKNVLKENRININKNYEKFTINSDIDPKTEFF